MSTSENTPTGTPRVPPHAQARVQTRVAHAHGDDEVVVSPERLRRGVEAMATAQRDLDQTLRELHDQLAGSLAEWSGPAREAYDEVQREWQDAAASMGTILQQLQVALGEVAEAHEDAQRSAARLWDR